MSATEPTFAHVPVMADEVLAWAAEAPAGLVVDATVGGAGHAQLLLEADPARTLLGLDRDPLAVRVATERLARFGDRAMVRHARYDALVSEVVAAVTERPSLAPSAGHGRAPVPSTTGTGAAVVSAVLFDLGVSSAQLDLPERGFSYRHEAPLDMRMDTTAPVSAADVINGYDAKALARVLRVHGDERFADRIARAIVAARPVRTTTQLAEIVVSAIPAATRRTGGHPAKRTFQAVRIEVNDELAVLERALDAALDVLVPGGRCIVLAYHSGEDRIVKSCFRNAETGGCTCPSGLPCVCGALPRGRMARRGVARPQAAELAANPRAASAVARVFEMAGPAAPTAGTGTLANRIAAPSSPTRPEQRKRHP